MTTQNSSQERLKRGARAAFLGLIVNAILSVGKILSGILGHSYALIADGVESLLDVFSSVVVIGGLRYAATPPDSDHPYGHGKAEPLAAAVVSLALIAAACALAVMSVKEILTPHHAPAAFTLFVLLGVIVVKETLFRFLNRFGEELESGTVKADAWHHRSDAITSAAAFIGISIALIGGEGYEAADDFAALFACGIIAWNGARLLRPALAEILDTAPDPEIAECVHRSARTVSGVLGTEKCRVRKMGLDYYVDLHVLVSGEITVAKGHEIAHRVKDRIREDEPRIIDVLVHIEPDTCQME